MSQDWLLDEIREDTDYSPMTLQIGLVGTDGIVLAGDLCGSSDALGVRQRTQSSKFCRAGDNLFAYSGGALAYLTAHACADAFEKGPADFQAVVKAAFDRVARNSAVPAPNVGGSVLAIVDKKLLRVNLTSFGPIFQSEIRDHLAVGDVRNPSIFFAERYWRADMETADLLPLAVMVICVGGNLYPESVQGLEVAIYRKDDGLSILEPYQLDPLKHWADKMDITIGQSVAKRLQV